LKPRTNGRGFFVFVQLLHFYSGRTGIRKQILLALLFAGGALAFAQTAKPKVTPLSASDAGRKKCPLHGTALKTENIGISYGLVKFRPGYLQAQKRLFPDANSRVLGGCIVSKDSPVMETVKFCPKCRAAEKRWFAAHRKVGFVR